jgi:hypothetical protein
MFYKFKNHCEKRFLSFLLIFIFSLMTGFSSFLHNHEFDLVEQHEDCSPCQWAQINTVIDGSSHDIYSIPFESYYKSSLTLVDVPKLAWPFSGLSPPFFFLNPS